MQLVMKTTCSRYDIIKAAMAPTLPDMKVNSCSKEFSLMNDIICSYVIRPVNGKISILMCISSKFIYIIFVYSADFVSLSIMAAATSTKNGTMTTLTITRMRRGKIYPTKMLAFELSSSMPPIVCL